MGQDVAVERLAELSAECTATDTTGQATEDGTRHGTEGDADGASERADSCASLATCQGSADAPRNTAHGADGSADFHGVMEGSDFGGETARALQ
ncbi:TPA: hypothetical protein N2B33_003779 [Pseudomonas aeruginosa]|nr:hypothetical protein [Pseudomonas aeruginosa]